MGRYSVVLDRENVPLSEHDHQTPSLRVLVQPTRHRPYRVCQTFRHVLHRRTRQKGPEWYIGEKIREVGGERLVASRVYTNMRRELAKLTLQLVEGYLPRPIETWPC